MSNRPCWRRSLPRRRWRCNGEVSQGCPQAARPQVLESLGFRLVREHEHIAMVRDNADGTQTPLTMPNHRRIKGSTLRTTAPRPTSPAMTSCAPIGERERRSGREDRRNRQFLTVAKTLITQPRQASCGRPAKTGTNRLHRASAEPPAPGAAAWRTTLRPSHPASHSAD
jgi:hypothetical protein